MRLIEKAVNRDFLAQKLENLSEEPGFERKLRRIMETKVSITMQGGKNHLWFLDCERKSMNSCINCIKKGRSETKKVYAM